MAPITSVPGDSRYTPVEYSRSKIRNTISQAPSRPYLISGTVTSRDLPRVAPTARAASSSSGPTCSSAVEIRRMP
jgi:hypothetical protein